MKRRSTIKSTLNGKSSLARCCNTRQGRIEKKSDREINEKRDCG
jgi:hypothetical protein